MSWEVLTQDTSHYQFAQWWHKRIRIYVNQRRITNHFRKLISPLEDHITRTSSSLIPTSSGTFFSAATRSFSAFLSAGNNTFDLILGLLLSSNSLLLSLLLGSNKNVLLLSLFSAEISSSQAFLSAATRSSSTVFNLVYHLIASQQLSLWAIVIQHNLIEGYIALGHFTQKDDAKPLLSRNMTPRVRIHKSTTKWWTLML